MVIFFGPAGAGKSAQGQLLKSKNNWVWLSAGQLFRDKCKDDKLVKEMEGGKLIPSKIINEIMADELVATSMDSKVVLDGYPRQMEQAEWLLANQPINGQVVELGIVFDVPESELEARMQSRGRVDDTPEAITERLRVYNDLTIPVLDYFSENKIKLVHIDGVGSIDEVHERIVREISACNLM